MWQGWEAKPRYPGAIAGLGIFFSFLLASCNKEEQAALAKEVARKTSELDELKKELGVKNDEASSLSLQISEMENAVKNLERLQKQELATAKEFNDAATYEQNLKSAVDYLSGRVSLWKAAARKSMVGRNLGTVSLADGRNLVDAVVTEVTDESVGFSHQGGDATVAFEALPLAVREQLVDEKLVVTKLQVTK